MGCSKSREDEFEKRIKEFEVVEKELLSREKTLLEREAELGKREAKRQVCWQAVRDEEKRLRTEENKDKVTLEQSKLSSIQLQQERQKYRVAKDKVMFEKKNIEVELSEKAKQHALIRDDRFGKHRRPLPPLPSQVGGGHVIRLF